jgi:RHS repeat-associated protein
VGHPPEGRVLKVDGGSTATYTYDADGNRVESITSSGTKDSVYNLDGQATVIENATTQAPIRANTWWGSSKLSFYTYGTSPTTYFVEQTPLGTVSGLTSMAGSIYSYSTSYPFGDGVTWYGSTDPDTLFYAGLDHDSETNTEHAWARQYSSTEAVWTIPDPYSGSYDPNNPQSFNRYAYVLNNPLIFTDTSGLELDGGGEGDGGGDSTDDEYQGQQVVCCTNGLFGALADFFSAIGDGISTAASAVAGFLAGGSDPSLGGGGPGFDGGLGGPGGGTYHGPSQASEGALSPRIRTHSSPFESAAVGKAYARAQTLLKNPLCSSLFLGKGLSTLNATIYSIYDLHAPNIGAETFDSSTVFINRGGPFFSYNDTSKKIMAQHHLSLVDFRAALLLHELGHQVGQFGPDVNRPSTNWSYTMMVLNACF